jgi:hypothetical protein
MTLQKQEQEQNQKQKQGQLPHPPPKAGGRVGHPGTTPLKPTEGLNGAPVQPGTRQPMALRPLALGAQDDTSNKIENKSKKNQLPHPPPKAGGRVGHPGTTPLKPTGGLNGAPVLSDSHLSRSGGGEGGAPAPHPRIFLSRKRLCSKAMACGRGFAG